jgi:hypothetical protein
MVGVVHSQDASDTSAPRPALFDPVVTAPANVAALRHSYMINKDGDGLGEELPSSVAYLRKDDQDFSMLMTVTDLSLCIRPLESDICRSFVGLIAGDYPSLGADITETRIGSYGAVNYYLAPVDVPTMKGVDSSRTFLVLTTQDPPRGGLLVLVYAKKGTNIIELSATLEDCDRPVEPGETETAFLASCASPRVRAAAVTKAQELVSLFAIRD